MSIFTKGTIDNVQEVIGHSTGLQTNHPETAAGKDEIEELNLQSQRIQELILSLNAIADNSSRELSQECIQEILSFYGHGLKRIMHIINNGNNSTASKDILNNLIGDSFVSSLLLIHDLHPLDLNTRLHLALEKVRPYMDSHGGNVEVISLQDGIAKIKLSGSCKGCPSSASTLELGIKQAVEENCPDLLELEVEGISPTANHSSPDARGMLTTSPHGWENILGVSQLATGSMKSLEVAGIPLLVCRVNGQLYAYRNTCPACDMPLTTGRLEGELVSCKLGHSYDVLHAGKCTGDPELHLDPFPLLQENGKVKIAVG